MADVETRLCLECEQVLPLTDFRKNHKMRGGYTNRCKSCLLRMDHARWAAMDPGERAATLERYRHRNREYRVKNASLVKARKADYFQRNKARLIEKTYAHRRKNPERLRELARGWSNRRRTLVAGGLTAKQQADWASAQKKVCHWCGKACAKKYHIDHVQPLSRGGKHEVRNLCIACPPCNLRKNNKDPIEWAQSLGKLL